MEKSKKQLGASVKTPSRSARVPSPKKATASRRSDRSRATAQAVERYTAKINITSKAWDKSRKKGKQVVEEWVFTPPMQRIMKLEEEVSYLQALATKNEFDRLKRGLAQNVANVIMAKDDFDIPFLHRLQVALGVNISLSFTALAARSGAKQSGASPTERKRATKGSGRKATPNKKS